MAQHAIPRTEENDTHPPPKVIMLVKFASLLLSKMRHEISTRPNSSLTTLQRQHSELCEDGVTILPSFFNEKQVETMLHALDYKYFIATPEMQHEKSNMLADRFLSDAAKNTELDYFFRNEALTSLIQSYFGGYAKLHMSFARIKENTGPVSSFENFWHFDSYKKRLKCFLYLSDVGPENAPVGYLKGSHGTCLSRISRELEMYAGYKKDGHGYAKDNESAYLGCYWPHEAKALQRRFEPVTCTGTAGTVVVFDGKGIHLANQLLSGKRIVLVSHWIQEHNHM